MATANPLYMILPDRPASAAIQWHISHPSTVSAVFCCFCFSTNDASGLVSSPNRATSSSRAATISPTVASLKPFCQSVHGLLCLRDLLDDGPMWPTHFPLEWPTHFPLELNERVLGLLESRKPELKSLPSFHSSFLA